MSFSDAELDEHCRYILRQRRIKNKVVVLCERKVVKQEDGRPSPQTYSRMEQMPDANFYQACVPSDWREYRPQFFNCGDRTHVIRTYFRIQELHAADPDSLFLKPHKLFALVDLDLYPTKTAERYLFPDTGTIFFDLYEKANVNLANVHQHRIWTTGLIYKEAYFLIPALQTFFTEYPTQTYFQSQPLMLYGLYEAIAQQLIEDKNLDNHLETAQSYIQHIPELDFTSVTTLSQTWLSEFRTAQTRQDIGRKQELAIALLTITQVKSAWKDDIQPDADYTSSHQTFRDNLSLQIAQKFYAKQDENATQYHIPCFMKQLRETTGYR